MRSLSRRQAFVGTLAATVLPTTANAAINEPHAAWIEEWSELDRIFWENYPEPDGLVDELHITT